MSDSFSTTVSSTRIPQSVAATVIDSASYTDDNIIYPTLKWLRDNIPVGKVELDGFDPFWIITKFQDVLATSRDARIFNNGNNNLILQTKATDDYTRSVNDGRVGSMDSIAFMDHPEHGRYRGIVTNYFTPRAVSDREEIIRSIAKKSVASFLELDGDCDVLQDFIVNYPLRVALSVLGVPEQDEPMILKLTQYLFGGDDPEHQRPDAVPGPDAAGRAWKATLTDFHNYFRELSADRRRSPRNDIISVIANAKIGGEHLKDYLEYDYYVAIATAGHDTTTYALAAGILGLASRPDQHAMVNADKSLIPSLVEETVRFSVPVKHFMRTAAVDTEIRGQPIKQGDRLMLSYPSANRDETVFERPDEFDVTRPFNKHLSFGFGPHTCLGRHLALFDMKVFFEELLPHVKRFELIAEPSYLKSNWISGLKSLPVRVHRT